MKRSSISRRSFIEQISLGTASVLMAGPLGLYASNHRPDRVLGVALVGLGKYSNGQLGPALKQTKWCKLAGVVTGSKEKGEKWASDYGFPVKNIYSYDTMAQMADNKDIDIVYIVTPNGLHAEHAIAAAKAGKHVICEKPMALSVEDCDKMIKACKDAGKSLSIGYRLHFEPYNLEMVRLGTGKVYGNIKKIAAGFGFTIGDPTQWRLKKALAGGGPMQDVGIYCVQGIIYTTGLEPIAVTAQEGPKTIADKFNEVEQSLKWQFDMPGGIIAEGEASYGHGLNFLKAEAEKGTFELSPAYNYGGLKGKTSDGDMNFPNVNQQAKQMDGIAMSIKNKQTSIVPGELGRRDVKIIAAVYEAMRTGKKINIK